MTVEFEPVHEFDLLFQLGHQLGRQEKNVLSGLLRREDEQARTPGAFQELDQFVGIVEFPTSNSAKRFMPAPPPEPAS